jgi:hypothetical protein
MAKDFESKKRKGMCSSVNSQLFLFLSIKLANFTVSMPERDAEKVKKAKNVITNASGAPAKKRKGIDQIIGLQQMVS